MQHKSEMQLKQNDLRRMELEFEIEKWKAENEEQLARIERKRNEVLSQW